MSVHRLLFLLRQQQKAAVFTCIIPSPQPRAQSAGLKSHCSLSYPDAWLTVSLSESFMEQGSKGVNTHELANIHSPIIIVLNVNRA